jgi:hypothetical protein
MCAPVLPEVLTNLTTMKLGSVILKHSIQDSKDENFHFYNSLFLTDDMAFQRIHFKKSPLNIPCIYQHNTASDDHEELPLQNRSKDQNNELLKIAILIATNACTKGILQAIINYGVPCCITPYIDNFIHQPTPIQNTALKGIAGCLTALGRVTIQLIIKQENQETTILVIDNIIYTPPACPIRLISPQQLHSQSKAKGH